MKYFNFCNHIAKPWVWLVALHCKATIVAYHTKSVKDSVSPVLILKRKFLFLFIWFYLLYFLHGFTWAKKYCKIKKFSKHNSQLAELYYCYTEWKTVVHVLCISLLFLSQSRSTMKKIAAVKAISSNKTGILSFPQKCLFTLRMVKVL